MVDLARVKTSLASAYAKIHGNPITSAAISFLLSEVPVIGPFLQQVYANTSGSDEDKKDAVLRLLQNLQKYSDEELQQLQANQKVLLENQTTLTKLVDLTGEVADRLGKVEERDKRIEEKVDQQGSLVQQSSQDTRETRADVVEIKATMVTKDDLRNALTVGLGSAGTLPTTPTSSPTRGGLKTLDKTHSSGATKKATLKTSGKAGISQSEDDLLKHSTLLQVEAGERVNDAVQLNRQTIQSEIQAAVVARDKTIEQILAEYIDPEARAKLQQAMSLIQKAEEKNPLNVDALLQHVQVHDWLDPTDKATRLKLMNRAVGLLGVPSNERERLQLAQATYYQAINSEPIDMAKVGTARMMFQELGRNEYVQQIDMLMGAGQTAPQPTGPVGNVPSFAGRWSLQFGSGEQEVVDIYPNGTFQGVLQEGLLQHTVTGQWVFDPSMGILGIQMLVDNYMPISNQLQIRGMQGNAYFGVDARGINFVMSRG